MPENRPLAARMRPVDLSEFVGQEHVIGEGRVLRKAIDAGQVPSMILWGPPGTGKTTLAAIAAKKAYPVYADNSIERFELISISAGMRGLQILLAPADFLRVAKATLAALAMGKV